MHRRKALRNIGLGLTGITAGSMGDFSLKSGTAS